MYLTVSSYLNSSKVKDMNFYSLKSYSDIMRVIINVSTMFNKSDKYWIIVSMSKSEFKLIPKEILSQSPNRNLDSCDRWIVYFDLSGSIVYETLEMSESAINIDPYEYKVNDIKVGDVVYFDYYKSYYIVTKNLSMDDSHVSCLSSIHNDSLEVDETSFIPLRYIRKASEYEIKNLRLDIMDQDIDEDDQWYQE